MNDFSAILKKLGGWGGLICFALMPIVVIFSIFKGYSYFNKFMFNVKSIENNKTFFENSLVPKNFGGIIFQNMDSIASYSGIAINKNFVKQDYSNKFCDDNYCYYSINMFGHITAQKSPPTITWHGFYAIGNQNYYGWNYQNVPFNTSKSFFNANCLAIDCQLKTVTYFYKKYLLLDIGEEHKYSGIVFESSNEENDVN